MKSIEEIISNHLRNKSIWIKNIELNSANLKPMSLNFRFLEVDCAVKAIKDKDFQAAKKFFFTASLLDELRVRRYNDNLFTYGLPQVCYPILSDNEELIFRYAKLRYQPWGNMKGMDENVLKGKSDIWCNTVQHFMANDIAGVERNLNIIETKSLPSLKEKKLLKDDYEFYKALLIGDKAKMEGVLEKLTSPKIHRKRNDHDILNQYVSFPALGYAKLAWRRTIEVDVISPLVPKELLSVEPLQKYEIPYDFLKDDDDLLPQRS